VFSLPTRICSPGDRREIPQHISTHPHPTRFHSILQVLEEKVTDDIFPDILRHRQVVSYPPTLVTFFVLGTCMPLARRLAIAALSAL